MEREELEEFLGEARLAHFATVDSAGKPRVRPVWFLWRDAAFWFTTRLETRYTGRDIAAGSPATVSIASEGRPYRAVLAEGRPEILPKDEVTLLEISTRYGEEEGRVWTAGAMREPDRVLLRMVPATMLSWNYGRDDHARQAKGESMRTDPLTT